MTTIPRLPMCSLNNKPIDIFERFPQLESQRFKTERAVELIRDCFLRGGSLFICGNGGSCADAEHIVGELIKGFRKPRPVDQALRDRIQKEDPEVGSAIVLTLQRGFPAFSLCSQVSALSAITNDQSGEAVFAQQLAAYGRPGDLLWAISTSGRSRNILWAAITARALGLAVLGFTGEGGGRLSELADPCITVPSRDTAETQEYHQILYHYICAKVEDSAL